MRVIVDMNLSPGFCDLLRQAGFDARHWSELGTPDAPDELLMAHARTQSAILLTHDLDFGIALALTRAGGPSIVQARTQDVSPEALGPLLVVALRQFESELTAGAIVTVHPDRTRARVLPLAR
jgi:predicted nuclease of predicted toxin-antitoxin system